MTISSSFEVVYVVHAVGEAGVAFDDGRFAKIVAERLPTSLVRVLYIVLFAPPLCFLFHSFRSAPSSPTPAPLSNQLPKHHVTLTELPDVFPSADVMHEPLLVLVNGYGGVWKAECGLDEGQIISLLLLTSHVFRTTGKAEVVKAPPSCRI